MQLRVDACLSGETFLAAMSCCGKRPRGAAPSGRPVVSVYAVALEQGLVSDRLACMLVGSVTTVLSYVECEDALLGPSGCPADKLRNSSEMKGRGAGQDPGDEIKQHICSQQTRDEHCEQS